MLRWGEISIKLHGFFHRAKSAPYKCLEYFFYLYIRPGSERVVGFRCIYFSATLGLLLAQNSFTRDGVRPNAMLGSPFVRRSIFSREITSMDYFSAAGDLCWRRPISGTPISGQIPERPTLPRVYQPLCTKLK